MLLEQIVDLTKRINKRNADKLKKQGQGYKVPSRELEEIQARKLGAKNRAKKLEDQIEKFIQAKKDTSKNPDD